MYVCPCHFSTRRETWPGVRINKAQLPKIDEVKYLGLHLDLKIVLPE
jgi:hypothetical protein